MLSTSSK